MFCVCKTILFASKSKGLLRSFVNAPHNLSIALCSSFSVMDSLSLAKNWNKVMPKLVQIDSGVAMSGKVLRVNIFLSVA